MDADSYLKITGRIKDIIIRGGENIHPLEIENCLLGHPKVAEVSVVGLPDERYGEVVAAFIIRAAGTGLSADEVKTWVREQLSNHLGKISPFLYCCTCFSALCTTTADLHKCRSIFSGWMTILKLPVVRFRSSSFGKMVSSF